jgi:palmitoyltransferase
MFLKVCCTQPGYLEKKQNFEFVEVLQEFQSSSVCPECEVLRTPRSRHCNLCKRCVDRFDHHCPWVNNCIGKNNFRYFYCFILSQSLYLFAVSVVSVSYIILEI